MASSTAWVALDVRYFRNPKVLRAGRDARELHLASICYAADELTDGRIDLEALPTIVSDAGITKPKAAIERLLAVGLWERNGSGGYVIHDFLDHQSSREQVEARRTAWNEQKRRAREARKNHGGGHA